MLAEEAEERYGSRLARAVVADPDSVLAELEERVRARARELVAAILLKSEAESLADELAGRPLADAEEAHAPFRKAVEEAEKAVAEAREAWKTQVMEVMMNPRAEDGSERPQPDSSPVERAWQVLKEAQSRAEETGRHVESIREKIRRLRAVPGPDPADVAILARALDEERRSP